MKKRILSILTAVCIAASTIFGGAIPAKAVTTRVMTTKFEIYQGSTKVAETSFAPSNSFNDVGYDYAKKWNVTLQGTPSISWWSPGERLCMKVTEQSALRWSICTRAAHLQIQ